MYCIALLEAPPCAISIQWLCMHPISFNCILLEVEFFKNYSWNSNLNYADKDKQLRPTKIMPFYKVTTNFLSFIVFIANKLNHLGGIWQQTTWSKISCLIFQFLNLWRQSWCAEKKREVPFVIFISFLNFPRFYSNRPVHKYIVCFLYIN